MDENTMLEALKTDLGITTTAYNTRLAQFLTSARQAIEDEGIVLTNSVPDGNLVVMYAGWLWRKRSTGEGMPRNLRWLMNNRLFRGKMSENTEG